MSLPGSLACSALATSILEDVSAQPPWEKVGAYGGENEKQGQLQTFFIIDPVEPSQSRGAPLADPGCVRGHVHPAPEQSGFPVDVQ